MITKGQARRIAAEWQAPGNACSALQHVGLIEDGLIDELRDNRKSDWIDNHARRELSALIIFAEAHGRGKVADWGDWDDTPIGERVQATDAELMAAQHIACDTCGRSLYHHA